MEKYLSLPLVFLMLFQFGCASQPTEVTRSIDYSSQVISGKISNIKQVEIGATIAQDILGSGIGMLIGDALVDGSSEDAAEVAGLFIGSEITNEIVKRNVDQLTIEGSDGKSYHCLVKKDTYLLGQIVSFNLDSNSQKIVAISKQK